MPNSSVMPRAGGQSARAALLAACLALVSCTGAPGSSSPAASVGATSTQVPASPSPTPDPTPGDVTLAAGLAITRPVDGLDQIFVIEPDGSPRQVTGLGENAALGATRPIWSPDRSMIAFLPPTVGAGLDPQLGVVNADGSEQRPIFTVGESTSWSSDSSRLLFCDSVFTTDNTGEPARMWIADVASGDVTLLAEAGTGPQWVPGDDSISYSPVEIVDPGEPLGPIRVAILPLGGGGPRPLAVGSGGWWSPDGSAVLLDREGDLYLAEPDGSDARLLVSGGPPVWSPDGARIVFGDVDSVGTFMVGVVDAEGEVLWSDVPGTDPTWSPDGTLLAVEVGFPDITTQILDAASGEVILELEGRHPAW